MSRVLTNSAERGIVEQTDYFDHAVANDENITGYYVVRTGDFVYNPRISSSAPVGPICRNELGGYGVMSPLYTVFRLNGSIDGTYLSHYFKTSAWHPFMKYEGNSGARSDRFSISDDVFFSMPIAVPSFPEQRCIGGLFSALDSLITLHQRKLDALRNVKRSLLDKMFPREGQTVPELRFAGFTDAWEQRRASEVFSIRDERGFPNLPVLSAVQETGMVPRDGSGRVVAHDAASEAAYKRVKQGDFVIHLRSFQGGFAHSPLEGITSPAYTVFSLRDSARHSDRYWKHLFSSKRFIASLSTVTYGIRDGRSISTEEFFDSVVAFPKAEEQKLIGATIDRLDSLITLHQRKLDARRIRVGPSRERRTG